MLATIDSPSHALTVIDKVRQALEEAPNLDCIKDIRDQAEAVRHYLKSASFGLDMQNRAAEVKLLAERQVGSLLKEMLQHGGDRKSDKKNDSEGLGALGISRVQSARWQREALLPDEDFVRYVQRCNEERREISSNGLLRLAKLFSEASKQADDRSDPFASLTNRLKSLAREQKCFACIHAEPPWSRPGRRGKIRHLVPFLSRLPVRLVAAAKAHLHLRVPSESLEDGLRLLRDWGFRYRTSLVCTTMPGDYGPYWRPAHETLLLGVRGDLHFHDNGLPSWVEGHTGLSTPLRELIERASLPSYLDLFGTVASAGWTTLG